MYTLIHKNGLRTDREIHQVRTGNGNGKQKGQRILTVMSPTNFKPRLSYTRIIDNFNGIVGLPC